VNASPLQAIPTNIITGFLGSGKTTAINHLLRHKPAQERWAVLINEFGQIGVDAALLTDSDGVEVRELAGGCLCCALGPTLSVTLVTLLRRHRPQRLLIEPTGLGHPARIIDTLQNEQFRSVLDLRSLICLLDPEALQQPDILANPSFRDQLNLADLVVLNRTDLASPGHTEQALAFARQLYPPKQAVYRVQQGELQPQWLDLVHDGQLSAQFPDAHAQTPAALRPNPLAPVQAATPPAPGRPLLQQGNSDDYFSYGWVFARQDRFDQNRITALLGGVDGIVRLKAALRIGDAWIGYNRNGTTAAESGELAWRRDSRLEIISRNQALCLCLKPA